MTTEEQAQPDTPDSVGQQLRRQREQRGLAIADVADELHLRPSVIQHIELGEHSRFDGELFLKGYVRAYAQLVGLDPDQLVAALDRELEPLRLERERAQLENPLVDIERRRQRKRQIARILFVLVVILLGLWLVFRFLMAPSPEPETAAASSQAPGAGGPDSAAAAQAGTDESLITPEPVLAPSPASAAAVRDDTDRQEAAAVAAEVKSGEEQPPEEQPLPAVPVAGPGEDKAETAADAAALSPEADSADPDRTLATVITTDTGTQADSGARLVMSFSDQCWVQVSDSSGKRLTAALKGPGDTLDVAGSAPLHVVIGAVDAVNTIMFQNEPVDLARFRSINNRTEFSLGP